VSRYSGTAADLLQAPREFRSAVLEDSSRRGARFRSNRPARWPPTRVREPGIEARLADSLASAGVRAVEVRAAFGPPRGRGGRSLLLSAHLTPREWLNASLATPAPDPWLAFRLGAATLILYLVVLGATLFLAARIVRPLRDLASARRASAAANRRRWSSRAARATSSGRSRRSTR
jgi:hypothetical protein